MNARMTHEQFIQAIRSAAVAYARAWSAARGGEPLSGEQLARVEGAKLVYGRGQMGVRGITQFGGWKNGQVDELIEVCALSQESWTQLAGTTLHELGHAAAGIGIGHGRVWKAMCAALGLRLAKESGMIYRKANFAPELRMAIEALPKPDDGLPNMDASAVGAFKRRGCKAGQGIRGGKARGAGSGSRQRKYVCERCGQIIRCGSDTLLARHIADDTMGGQIECGMFVLDEAANKQGKAARSHAGMAAALAQLFGGAA